MNRTILLILLSFFALPKMFAQFEGTVGFGGHVGYATEINSLGVGLHTHYYRTNNIRLAPTFTYFAPNNGKGMWMADADAHIILPVSISASLYPIGGLHFSHWTFDAAAEERFTRNRLGANIGLGFQHDISYRVRANFELKYQFIRDYSQVFLMAGFGFWF